MDYFRRSIYAGKFEVMAADLALSIDAVYWRIRRQPRYISPDTAIRHRAGPDRGPLLNLCNSLMKSNPPELRKVGLPPDISMDSRAQDLD